MERFASTAITTVFKLFGLIQYNDNLSESKKLSILNLLLAIPLTLVFLYSFYLNIENTLDPTTKQQTVLIYDISTSALELYTANVTFTLFWYLIQRNKIRNLFNDIKHFENSLDNVLIATNAPKEKYSKRFYQQVLFNYLAMLFLICLDTVKLIHVDSSFIYYLVFLFPHAFAATEYLHMYSVMDDLWVKFNLINRQYKKFAVITNIKDLFPLMKVDKLDKFQQEDIDYSINCIENLSHTHYDLCKLTIDANNLFTSLTFIFTIWSYTLSTIQSILNLLRLITALHAQYSAITIIDVLRQAGWIIFFSNVLISTIRITTSVATEANKPATYIHDIWNKYANTNVGLNAKIRHLELLSVRFLNTKLYLTAKDYLPLNWSVLQTIAATMTTFLIILIQLKMY